MTSYSWWPIGTYCARDWDGLASRDNLSIHNWGQAQTLADHGLTLHRIVLGCVKQGSTLSKRDISRLVSLRDNDGQSL